MIALAPDLGKVRGMNWRTLLLSIGMLGGSFIVIELLASVLTEVASR